jgi:prophage DNA circulation protein
MALLIFLGGVACGAGIATVAVTHAVHRAMTDPESVSAHVTDRLAAMLDLSDAQTRQVRQIILRRHGALVDIRRDIQPRLETELTVLEDEIAAILDDQQRATWRAHAHSMRAKWLPPIPKGLTEK